ncbi:addiction module antidote protein [Methylobacterium sp. D53M]
MTYERLEDIPAFDAAEYLTNPSRVVAYLEAVLEKDDPALLSEALGDIARSHGMAAIAKETGRSREQLYRTLSARGNPQLDTLMGVLRALGLRLSVQPIAAQTAEAG